METEHAINYKNILSFQAQPQIILNKKNVNTTLLRFQKLVFKADFGYVEFTVGRENILWGVSSIGGLLFSDNAPPMDMIKLSTTGQKKLPWFLKRAGTYQFASFIANMGDNYFRSNAKLAAYRFDYQPTEK